jgi:septal ring-binding cell division protein DamX
MISPRSIQRGYRSFRRNNRDEYLTLFLFLDTAFWLLKNLFILACLFLLYQVVAKRFFAGDESTTALVAEEATSLASSQIDSTTTELANTDDDTVLALNADANAEPVQPDASQVDTRSSNETLSLARQTPAPAPVETVATEQPGATTTPLNPETGSQTTPIVDRPAATSPITLADQKWILEQDPRRYTIQFGTSPNRDLLLEQALTLRGDQDPAVYPFKRTPSGRPVFGLSSGLYDSFDAAEQQLASLPESLKTFQPWIRPLNDLQRQIRAMEQ